MKKIILKMYLWFFWIHFCIGLKSVLGHKTLKSSFKEMQNIENIIRTQNELKQDDLISWNNTLNTNRVVFSKYVTLKYFNQIGELLLFFRTLEQNRILEAENVKGC